jgi:hypothetical protein
VERISGIFDLTHDNPIAFELFIDWLYSNNKQAQNFCLTGTTDSKSWELYAVEACIIADKFFADDFSKFALGKVVQNAHLLDVYDMERIYEDTLPNSALRRFAARWARWRYHLQPTLWESSRNREFQRDRCRWESHMENQTVVDPRGFEIEHWYAECSRTGAPCHHATVQTGSDPTTNVQKTPDLPRVWSKRERHNRFTQTKTLLPAFLVAYSSTLVKLGVATLILGILVMVVAVSITYCHCGHCSGCHGCGPCRGCNCYPCHHWCTHHAFLFCCSCGDCEYCGGFPFCWCVQCCCRDGYDNDGSC